MSEMWSAACAELKGSVGENNFRSWIAPLRFLGIEGSSARLAAPTGFLAAWVERHFADGILNALRHAGLAVERLEIIVNPETAARAEAAALRTTQEQAGAEAQPASELPGAPLDPRFTFETFVIGKPNELAHAAARRVARGEDVAFNPLFLYGGVGLGKTHLMHAIGLEYGRRHPGRRILFLSAEQFMYRFVQALRERDTLSFKEMFRSVDLLMIDDVQFIAGKDSTQEEFFHTFNALADQNRQIVLSADRAPGEIDGIEERIRSRMQWGLVVDIHPADFELRLGILQQKLELYRRHHPEVEIAPGVLEFVARRIASNIRELEGALTRLLAFASLVGREITLEMTREVLADLLRQNERKLSIDEIIRRVSEHYGVRVADLVGPRRSRSVARPRQVAMYLAKQLTTRSLPEIGRSFGGRDHTTVIHAVRRIEELMATDPRIAEDCELLRRSLER